MTSSKLRWSILVLLNLAAFGLLGCASVKESDTARTGIEQLLLSSAIDDSLDRIDLRPIAGANVFLKTDYLDCVDKNYVIVGMHSRLLKNSCKLADKAEDADVVLEVASGGVGTDRTDLTVGTPEVPLGLMGSVPKLTVYERKRAMGTAKLVVVATDVKSKQTVINNGFSLARSDHQFWSAMGSGPVMSGTVVSQLQQHTGQSESLSPTTMFRSTEPSSNRIPAQTAGYQK
jgi:hypothetical protein